MNAKRALLSAPLVAVCTLVVACASRPPVKDEPAARATGGSTAAATATAQHARAPAPPCPSHSLLVRAASPNPGEPSATLVIDRRGEGMKEKSTCLRVGNTSKLLAPGKKTRVAIAANVTKFARLTIGTSDVLLPVEPEGTVTLGDHPCFGWALSAAWLDPFGADERNAYCRAPDAKCKKGYTAAGPPGPVQDPLCADDRDDHSERRCVRNTTLHLADPGLALREFGAETDTPVEAGKSVEVGPSLMPAHCGLPELATGDDRVLVAAPAGARLDVLQDSGHIAVVAR